MNKDDIYKLIVQNDLDNATKSIEKFLFDDCSRLALTSLTLCRQGNFYEAKNLIAKIDESECDSFSKSVLLESQLIISDNEKTSFDKAADFADQALYLNPRAVFARVIKSQYAFKLGNVQTGIDYILSIGEDYPHAKWIYIVLIRFLIARREFKSAQQFVVKIEPGTLRVLYYILVKILIPYLGIWISGTLMLFVFCNISPSILFIIFAIPFLVVIVYSIIKKYQLIYRSFLIFSYIVLLIYIIISALKN